MIKITNVFTQSQPFVRQPLGTLSKVYTGDKRAYEGRCCVLPSRLMAKCSDNVTRRVYASLGGLRVEAMIKVKGKFQEICSIQF